MDYADKIAGNVGIGTTNPGGGTGSSVLSLANSSAAPTALANTTHLYSSAGEGYWMDAAGNATLQTPHNPETGEWIFSSQNLNTGKTLRVEMKRLTKDLDRILGGGYVFENGEPYTKEKESLLSTISNLKQRIALLEAQPQNQTPSTGVLTQEQESILASFAIGRDGHLVVKGNLEIEGKLKLSKDSRGYNIPVTQGTTSLEITFTKPRDDINYAVSVTPSWLTQGAVTEKRPSGFKVEFGTSAPPNAKTDWIVVD